MVNLDFICEYLCMAINYTRCNGKLGIYDYLAVDKKLLKNSTNTAQVNNLFKINEQFLLHHHQHHKKCKLSSKNLFNTARTTNP